MTEDALFFSILTGIAGSAILTLLLTRWRKTKGATSVFAQDDGLESIGLSALSNAFHGPVRQTGTRTEIRPPWGLRLGAPVLGAVFLLFSDISSLFALADGPNPALQFVAMTGLTAALGFSTYMLLFKQRVIYDTARITCEGISLTPQHRSLAGLTDISLHPQRPALVLSFSDQDPLYVPKFLSGRDRFVADMKAIAERNRSTGLRPRKSGLRDRLGV